MHVQLGDGLLTNHPSPREVWSIPSADIINYTHANRLAWYSIGPGWLHPRHQDTQTLPKHHRSAHMDSSNMEIWCVPHLCAGAIYDKTNRETCQSGVQSYGIPSVHTLLEDLLQHTSIPWIEKQDICCMLCQLCRWPTNKEKSTRTLDHLQQCSYHMKEQQTTDDSSFYNWGWTWPLCLLSKISTSYHEDIGKHGIPRMVSWC